MNLPIPSLDELLEPLSSMPIVAESVKTAMIAFAKMHVEAALKAASEKAYTNGTYRSNEGHLEGGGVNKGSILTAYSLENIK